VQIFRTEYSPEARGGPICCHRGLVRGAHLKTSIGTLVQLSVWAWITSLGCVNGSGGADAGRGQMPVGADAGGDVAAPPCLLDCEQVCVGQNSELMCGDALCGFWQCEAACKNAQSTQWCCILINGAGARLANALSDCAQMPDSAQGIICPQSESSVGTCGQASPGQCGGGEGTSACPYCCLGICGADIPACFSRADCCSDTCGGGLGTSGQGIECNYGSQGRCVDSANDYLNCGACGNSCPAPGPTASFPDATPPSPMCAGGSCQCLQGLTLCPSPTPCVPGRSCPSSCAALATDPNNCGQCGARCLSGQVCTNSQCQCPVGTTLVGTCCTSGLASDSNNCGMCGQACPPASSCVSGQCVCNAVGPNSAICNGVCRSLAQDPENCGACGQVCGSNSGCVQGVCVTGATCPSATSCSCPTGQGACGSACVDMQTDQRNCGECGDVCGGTCTAGRCAVTLASDQTGDGIAVDSANVYWTNVVAGTVMKCAIGGCGGNPTKVATGQVSPRAIAVDAANVYWIDVTPPSMVAAASGTVMECAIGGCGQPSVLASLQTSGPTIAVDGRNVYWTNASGLVVCSGAGCAGAPTVVVPGASAFTISGTNIYFTDETKQVKMCAIGSCGSGSIVVAANASGAGDPYSAIAFDGENVYLVDSREGLIWLAPLGGTAGLFANFNGGGLVADASGVYWVNLDGALYGGPESSPTVYMILGGFTPLEYATGGGLATDLTSVYWSSGGSIIRLTPK